MGTDKAAKRGAYHTMAERRKSSKPIMERRRRERINNSLNELKNLLLETRKKDSSCCSKLEKADILEMTVQHLKSMRNIQEIGSSSNDPVALAHYRAGFNQSAAEISRYLVNAQDIEVQVRTRLLTHLSNSCHAVLSSPAPTTALQYPQPSPFVTGSTSTPEMTTPILSDPQRIPFTTPDPSPCLINPAQLQLMPANLTNGKIAAVLVPSTQAHSATCCQQFPPVQPSQTVADPSLLTSARNRVSPQNVVSLNTSAQASDDPTVWRPW